jgi:hypothetical protein
VFLDYQKAYNEKDRIYHHYMSHQGSEALDTLRSDLLEHLAGSIVVKEHRLRYQKEQYERFVASLQDNGL